MKIKILPNFHGKYSKKFFREIDLLDFTSFLVWTFFNFLAHYGSSESDLLVTSSFFCLEDLFKDSWSIGKLPTTQRHLLGCTLKDRF